MEGEPKKPFWPTRDQYIGLVYVGAVILAHDPLDRWLGSLGVSHWIARDAISLLIFGGTPFLLHRFVVGPLLLRKPLPRINP